MNRYGIIAIGYNRKKSLQRLLNALAQADYGKSEVLLIISLDYAGMSEIIEAAEKYDWKHGPKIVKAYKERQGLRRHILNCGNYMEEYRLDAVAVFEDDIYPSPAFFQYMCQAVEFYQDNRQIAGISLYTHLWNVNCEIPFQPLPSKYDVFFLQYAQSWGQIWLAEQWKEFRKWYEEHGDAFLDAPGVPPAVSGWKDTSWLKYHIRYCVEKKKYFVYPYESLCTNFTEIGTHNQYKTALYQVPLQTDLGKQYRFVLPEDASAVYDAFFESERLADVLQMSSDELCVDLYGSKPQCGNKKYWLTTVKADLKIERTYGLALRPQELNVVFDVPGDEIKLYNLHQSQKDGSAEISVYQYFDYYFRLTHVRWKQLAKLLAKRIWLRIRKKI